MYKRGRASVVGRVVRWLSALSVVTGMFLTVVGMVEGPTASAQTNVVGQVADATGNLSLEPPIRFGGEGLTV